MPAFPRPSEVLREGIREAGPALDAEIIAAGHAHIDVAWLWTLAHTRRKTSRTFRTALALMDAFPDFHFTQSQPQLYEFIKRGRARAVRGDPASRWRPDVGSRSAACGSRRTATSPGPSRWRGSSCSAATSSASTFGQDADSPVLWLPDVFGYTWSLPQLIKLAGLDYFFTIKIGWNKVNQMPFDSFWWQGLDGTTRPDALQHHPFAAVGGQPGPAQHPPPTTPT